MIYFLDLIGTFAFAIGGAYKAKSEGLNIFGVILLGIITSIGGGTIRDLILGRTPLFYISDPNYIALGVIAGIITYYIPDILRKTYTIFRFTDSIGIAAFSIIGVLIGYNHLIGLDASINFVFLMMISVFLGTLTAVGGGIIRDSLMGDTPYALKEGSNYISSAFIGSLVFFGLMFYNQTLAIMMSIMITLFLREIISPHGMVKKGLLKNKMKTDNK